MYMLLLRSIYESNVLEFRKMLLFDTVQQNEVMRKRWTSIFKGRLKLGSYNFKNVKSSIHVDEIHVLCNTCDIIVFQETWFMHDELTMLGSKIKEFYANWISSIDSSKCVITGRPYGFLAIL